MLNKMLIRERFICVIRTPAFRFLWRPSPFFLLYRHMIFTPFDPPAVASKGAKKPADPKGLPWITLEFKLEEVCRI